MKPSGLIEAIARLASSYTVVVVCDSGSVTATLRCPLASRIRLFGFLTTVSSGAVRSGGGAATVTVRSTGALRLPAASAARNARA